MDTQLFRCVSCNRVDVVDIAATEANHAGVEVRPNVCTKCLTSEWHHRFPYNVYDPEHDHVRNPM